MSDVTSLDGMLSQKQSDDESVPKRLPARFQVKDISRCYQGHRTKDQKGIKPMIPTKDNVLQLINPYILHPEEKQSALLINAQIAHIIDCPNKVDDLNAEDFDFLIRYSSDVITNEY